MKKVISAATIAASMLVAGNVHAAGFFDTNNFYLGGGLSSNSLGAYDDATGYQILAGLPMNFKMGPVKSAIEVGYMDAGDFEASSCNTFFFFGTICTTSIAQAKGVWANYVATIDITDNLEGIARAGLDFGDDDGLMQGVGIGYSFTNQMALRGEFVMREHVDSLQVNLVYRMN